jgi:hypothetical protein
MNFKEFLEQQEKNEGILTPLQMLAGAGGNLTSQLARGIGNVGKGTLQTGYGLSQAALAGIQAASGGTKVGKESIRRSKENLKQGIGSFARGATQAIASPVSAIARAGQIANEPFLKYSGAYAPASKNPNRWQDLFGLDGWKDPPKPEPTPEPKPEVSKRPTIKITKANIDNWNKLIELYKQAKTKQEKLDIQKRMALEEPMLYMKRIKSINSKLKRK